MAKNRRFCITASSCTWTHMAVQSEVSEGVTGLDQALIR
jgi:hypothetical protein